MSATTFCAPCTCTCLRSAVYSARYDSCLVWCADHGSVQGESERFVIHLYVELPPLQVVAEIPHPEITGQELSIKCRVFLLSQVQLLGEDPEWLRTAAAAGQLLRGYRTRLRPRKLLLPGLGVPGLQRASLLLVKAVFISLVHSSCF